MKILDQLEEKLCKKLRISKDELIRFSIVRESIDARKDPIMFSYTLECEVRHEAALLRRRLRRSRQGRSGALHAA